MTTTKPAPRQIADAPTGTLRTEWEQFFARVCSGLNDLTSNAYQVGGTDVAVADGGTGASTATGARTNLGFDLGTELSYAYDLHMLTKCGLYYVQDPVNAPSGVTGWNMVKAEFLATGYGVLYLYPYTGYPVYVCDQNNGTWNSWSAEVRVQGDTGGVADLISITGAADITSNSTGVGSIKFKGTTSRDSSGFIKIYVGTTAYYIPVFSAVTG